MAVTIDIYYDTRKFRTKTKDYPFKLKVYYNDETRNFLTVYGLSEPEQRKLLSPRLGIELQSIKDGLADLQRTAETFVRDMRPFSFDDFILYFLRDNPHIDQTRILIIHLITRNSRFCSKNQMVAQLARFFFPLSGKSFKLER